MKRYLITGLVLAVFSLIPRLSTSQITADPLVSAAVATSSAMEKEALDKINNEQSSITSAQLWINNELGHIKDIQKKTYDYLTTISATVSNAHDVKKAYDCTVEIGRLCIELKNAVAENPKGFMTTAVGTKQRALVRNEMLELYSYVANLTLNKKQLLDAYERLVITGQIVYRLKSICFKLRTLTYCVYSLSFRDLPRLIAPDIYYSTVAQKDIARSIINSW